MVSQKCCSQKRQTDWTWEIPWKSHPKIARLDPIGADAGWHFLSRVHDKWFHVFTATQRLYMIAVIDCQTSSMLLPNMTQTELGIWGPWSYISSNISSRTAKSWWHIFSWHLSGFPKWGSPKNGWFIEKIPLKWMIWGYLHFRKPPSNHDSVSVMEVCTRWWPQVLFLGFWAATSSYYF